MKRGFVLSLFFVVIIATNCLSNDLSLEKETRDLKGFKRVSFGVSGNLYINFGSEFKVILEGEKSLLDDIETELSGDKLIIKMDNWRLGMNDKVTVYITMPELAGLGVSGSGKAEVRDAVKAEDLDLSVSGSGKIFTSAIRATNLDCSISGSGDIIMGEKGNVDNAEISISGSGNYTGESLKIASLETSISGSGNCICNVTESLEARVSGSGNVTYYGNPKIDARVSGSGRVRSK
jgi:hypothetical protein